MAVSRSALDFLRRKGLVTDMLRPGPRLNVSQLLVHTVPIPSPPKPLPHLLTGFEGDPPPDRGMSRPWPGQP